jgi:hypothetical protein
MIVVVANSSQGIALGNPVSDIRSTGHLFAGMRDVAFQGDQ